MQKEVVNFAKAVCRILEEKEQTRPIFGYPSRVPIGRASEDEFQFYIRAGAVAQNPLVNAKKVKDKRTSQQTDLRPADIAGYRVA